MCISVSFRFLLGPISSVVDRHRFDADPDQTFHFKADPDLDWHRNNADPHADLTPSFTQVGELGKHFTFIHSNAGIQCFILLPVADLSCFKYFGRHFEIFL
jgi:hypothetical protein